MLETERAEDFGGLISHGPKLPLSVVTRRGLDFLMPRPRNLLSPWGVFGLLSGKEWFICCTQSSSLTLADGFVDCLLL